MTHATGKAGRVHEFRRFSTGHASASRPSAAQLGLLVGTIALALSCEGGQKASVPPGTGPLNMEQAQQYVLELVNRDRAEAGLSALEWDPVAAKAAERHARNMALNGYTAHWGTDGSVPEQRYSEAGGKYLVRENAACFFDGKARELDPNPMFERAELEKIELAFISEVPPHDGHRKNILEPTHTHGGIGLAKPLGIKQACMAQELVGVFGEFDDIPESAKANSKLRVAGEVREPVVFGGIGVKRLPKPGPRTPTDLNQTSSYPVPAPDVIYFPKGFVTPLEVKVDGNHFELDVPLGKPGLYEISIWGKFPGSGPNELRMASLRTIVVE